VNTRHVVLVAAWLLIALAVNVPMLYAGRVVAGFCVGIVSLCFPVYLGETLQPEVRGMLGLLPTAFGNVGKLHGDTTYISKENIMLPRCH
jgi:facilitated trehalose transporter